MTHRYFVPRLPPGGGPLALPEAESRHAAQVMRVQSGDTIELFDGQNRAASALVLLVTRREVTCDARPPRLEDHEPGRRIVAAVAIPKGDRSRMLVEKLTELGVDRLIPLVCERSQWKPSAAALEKLERAVIEACKQCGRNRLMQIAPPETPAALWSRQAAIPGADRWIAIPSAAAVAVPQAAATAAEAVIYAVGPEGGFTQQEIEAAARADWQSVRLGPRVYRIETAAIVLAAWAGGGR